MNSKKNKSNLFKQARNWAFTDFEFLDFERIYNEYKDIIRYICWGHEICPSTGRKHLQGWIQLINKKTKGGLLRLLGTKKLWLNPCYASEFNNDNYCKKDNNFQSFGKFIRQGQRTDLEDVFYRIKQNEPLENIAEDYESIFMRYSHGLKELKKFHLKRTTKEFRHVNVEVYYGKTGVGKTKKAVNENPCAFLTDGAELSNGWFDGYSGEKTLIIDEYDSDVKITRMLKLLDGYQQRLPVKGSFVYANWDKVIITSNINPNDWHPNAKEEHRKALFRRINNIVYFGPISKPSPAIPSNGPKYRLHDLEPDSD